MTDDSLAVKAVRGEASPQEREILATAALHRQQRRVPAIVRYDAFNTIKWIALGGGVIGSALLAMWSQDLDDRRDPLEWRYYEADVATVETISPRDGSGPREIARDDLRETIPMPAAIRTDFLMLSTTTVCESPSEVRDTLHDVPTTMRVSRRLFSAWRTVTLDFRWSDLHLRTRFKMKCERWRPPRRD